MAHTPRAVCRLPRLLSHTVLPLQIALRVLPTLGSTALLMLTMARCKHPLALPGAGGGGTVHAVGQ